MNDTIKNARILVVDDHPANLLLATKLLQKRLGVAAETAASGKEALEKLGRKAYDLVLMDCHMPQMDGFEATAGIRAQEKDTGRHLPIIALTGDAMRAVKERCLACGMDNYLSKPLDPDRFIRMVTLYLEEGAAAEISAFAETEDADTDDALPVNLKNLRHYAGDDKEEMRELCASFFGQAYELMTTLKNACGEPHADQWRQAAHKLKGSSASLGANALWRLAKEAESGVNAPEEEKRRMAVRMEQELETVHRFLTGELGPLA